MTGNGPGRKGAAWNRMVKEVKATSTHCGKCGRQLLPDLKYPHRWSTSIDHITPISMGGDPLDRHNLQAAHLFCNIREGRAIADRQRPAAPRVWNDTDF